MDYNKLLEKARKAYSECVTGAEKRRLESLFPELRESEDERIRKELIRYLPYCDDISKDTKERWIAWLEKQGETYTKKDVDDAYLKGICDAKRELEKQGEQNVGKIEPKFKVCDWVVHDMSDGRKDIRQIIGMTNKSYILDCEDFNTFYFNDLENDYHLWTIEDAKDGDVLAIGNEYFLFKEKKENTSPAVYISHCFADSAGAFRVTNGRDCGEFLSIENGVNACPANKEQCEFLFSKMKEAGYEWDINKKELKKIDNKEVNEENYGIDGLWHAKTILEKTLGKVEGYQTDDGILEHKSAINAITKLCEQKPAWSEEDEGILNGLISSLARIGANTRTNSTSINYSFYREIEWLKSLKNRVGYEVNCTTTKQWSDEDEKILGKCIDAASGYYSPEDKQSMKDWLESLKNRVQPKQEWSKDDEEFISILIERINQLYVVSEKLCKYEDRDRLDPKHKDWLDPKHKDWLIEKIKSLKPQPHWKPTDEQMQSLNFAIVTYSKKDDCKLTYDGLNSLYNDLKKL